MCWEQRPIMRPYAEKLRDFLADGQRRTMADAAAHLAGPEVKQALANAGIPTKRQFGKFLKLFADLFATTAMDGHNSVRLKRFRLKGKQQRQPVS